MSGFYWIVAYPKSGSTWLRLSLSALVNGGDLAAFPSGPTFAPNAGSRWELEETLDVESADLTSAELIWLRPAAYRLLAAGADRPLFRKVHEARLVSADGVHLFPPDVTLGVIYMVRDPRDVAVSWAHYFRRSLDDAVADLCNPTIMIGGLHDTPTLQLPQPLSCWSGHAESWLDAPGPAPCLVRYEDMLADPLGSLRRVAEYAAIPHNREGLEKAVAATRFDTLRDKERRHGFKGGQVGHHPFFRSGRAGGWRGTLSEAQEARIRLAHGPMMDRFGYGMHN